MNPLSKHNAGFTAETAKEMARIILKAQDLDEKATYGSERLGCVFHIKRRRISVWRLHGEAMAPAFKKEHDIYITHRGKDFCMKKITVEDLATMFMLDRDGWVKESDVATGG